MMLEKVKEYFSRFTELIYDTEKGKYKNPLSKTKKPKITTVMEFDESDGEALKILKNEDPEHIEE